MFRQESRRPRPASAYLQCKGELDRNLIEEVKEGGFQPTLEDSPKPERAGTASFFACRTCAAP